jgi:hypothetical protein
MPDARGMFFVINERQRRWWLDAEGDRRSIYAKYDAAPLPTEPQRERSTFANRLVFRLRLIIRPAAGYWAQSVWKTSRRASHHEPGSRSR